MSDIIITIRDASVRFNLAMQRQMSLKDQISRLIRKDRWFQEFFALKHINLEIRRGESWGFIGRNGSGKSTLLKLVTGILAPYEGEVAVSGIGLSLEQINGTSLMVVGHISHVSLPEGGDDHI